MSRGRQIPTREVVGDHSDDYRETHPAYVMLGASRVQSNGVALAGSDFEHRDFITISIREAYLSRGLANDWWHAHKLIAEVALSEAQWATFISTLNVGHGVPATLEFRESVGEIPAIERVTERREQHRGEIDATLADALAAIDAIIADPRASKSIRDKAETARRELRSNLPFVADQFAEHAEKVIEHAKVEVEAYVTGAIQRAGLKALGAEPMIALAEGTGGETRE